MRKILPNNEKSNNFLNSLPKLYLVGCWAKFGIREYAFSGKSTKDGIPLVYEYRDRNGATDEFYLTPINLTTTGSCLGWTVNKDAALEMAEALNKMFNFSY